MKKNLLTVLVIGSVCCGAKGQGSINIDAGLANNPGITTQGANATSTVNATTWFTGTISLEVFALASASQSQLNAINSYLSEAYGIYSVLDLLRQDGFIEVSTTTPTGSTVGAVTGSITDGSFEFNPAIIGLSSAVTTESTESLALYATAVGGPYDGWSGIIAFYNNVGGNYTIAPLGGPPANLSGWGSLNENLVLSPQAVPEPTAIVLAGLGSLSLFLFRRKK
jgi:hypothetical protein